MHGGVLVAANSAAEGVDSDVLPPSHDVSSCSFSPASEGRYWESVTCERFTLPSHPPLSSNSTVQAPSLAAPHPHKWPIVFVGGDGNAITNQTPGHWVGLMRISLKCQPHLRTHNVAISIERSIYAKTLEKQMRAQVLTNSITCGMY